MNKPTQQYVTVERIGQHVLLLVLNRPEARNAVNTAFAAEVGAWLAHFEADPELRIGVFAANGVAFCAGGDNKEDTRAIVSKGGFAGFTQVKRTKPWIACVQGLALGGGAEIALCCEMLVMSENATMLWPGVHRGFVPRAVGAVYAPRRLPANVFHEVILTGQPLTAQRAYLYGLANSVVPVEKVREEALRLAELAAKVDPAIAQSFFAKARSTAELPLEEAWRLNDEAVARGEL
ncbi:enoyl-CoA hydratase-related protein [Ramlibacter sp.]|uniref:enoyl-CoA hydratase-related protein n=1 Tax=Ramlibacter sp. TaxID=1917967 RepID=UPI003D114BDC